LESPSIKLKVEILSNGQVIDEVKTSFLGDGMIGIADLVIELSDYSKFCILVVETQCFASQAEIVYQKRRSK
jgi:hypothetical protein